MFGMDATHWFLVIISCTLLTVTLIINLVLLSSVALLRKQKLDTNKITIFSLATINLLTAASYHPVLISFILQGTDPSKGDFSVDWATLCKILSGLERGVIVTITWSIASACLDKYLSLFHSIRSATAMRYTMTVKLSLIIVFSAWMIGTVFGVFSYLLTEHKQSNVNHCCHLSLDFYGIYHLVYCAAYITLGFIVPSIIMILLYSYTTKQLFIHRTLIAKNPFQSNQITTKHKRLTLNGKVRDSKLLVILVLFFLLTVTPYFVMNLILSTGHWTSMEFPDSVYIALVLLLYTNCCICPLLCGFSNERIRLVLVDTIKQRMTLWLRYERRGMRHETSEEISFISADCSLPERSLSVSSRSSVVAGESVVSVP